MSKRAPQEAMRNPLPNKFTTVGAVEVTGWAIAVLVALLAFSKEVTPENLRSQREAGVQLDWLMIGQYGNCSAPTSILVIPKRLARNVFVFPVVFWRMLPYSTPSPISAGATAFETTLVTPAAPAGLPTCLSIRSFSTFCVRVKRLTAEALAATYSAKLEDF